MIYSEEKASQDELAALEAYKESVIWSCGASLFVAEPEEGSAEAVLASDVDAAFSRHRASPVLLLKLRLPADEGPPAADGQQRYGQQVVRAVQRAISHASPALGRATRAFGRRCADITTRSRKGKECNNMCS